MAEENNDIVEDTLDKLEPENKDEEINLEVDKDVPDSEGNKLEDGGSIVKGFMEKLGIGKNKKEEVPENSKQTEELEISDEFYKAAIGAGWTKDDIMDFVLQDGERTYTDEELIDMIPFLLDDDTNLEPEDEPPAKKEETPKSQDKSNLESEELKAIKEEIRKEFQGELDNLKKSLGEVGKDRETQRAREMLNTINRVFDEAGKEFEAFGNTDKLPVFPAGPKKGQLIPTSPQVKARNEVLQRANAFIAMGTSVEEAMADALDWYKGRYLSKDVKRNLIKDMKDKEKKLSAKRSRKELTPHVEFEDEEAYQADFIKKQAAKLGIRLNED